MPIIVRTNEPFLRIFDLVKATFQQIHPQSSSRVYSINKKRKKNKFIFLKKKIKMVYGQIKLKASVKLNWKHRSNQTESIGQIKLKASVKLNWNHRSNQTESIGQIKLKASVKLNWKHRSLTDDRSKVVMSRMSILIGDKSGRADTVCSPRLRRWRAYYLILGIKEMT